MICSSPINLSLKESAKRPTTKSTKENPRLTLFDLTIAVCFAVPRILYIQACPTVS